MIVNDYNNKQENNNRRQTAKVMIPIFLGSVSGMDSDDSDHQSDEWSIEPLNAININNFDDFLREFWLSVESELHSDINLRSTNSK